MGRCTDRSQGCRCLSTQSTSEGPNGPPRYGHDGPNGPLDATKGTTGAVPFVRCGAVRDRPDHFFLAVVVAFTATFLHTFFLMYLPFDFTRTYEHLVTVRVWVAPSTWVSNGFGITK